MWLRSNNIRNITEMSCTYFLVIFFYILRINVISGNENAVHFSEYNCSINDIKRITTDQPDTIIITNCSFQSLPNAVFLAYSHAISLNIYNTDLQIIEDFALNCLKRLETLQYIEII